MAPIKIVREHSLDIPEAKKMIDKFVGKLDKWGINGKWKGDTCVLGGTGLTGKVDLDESEICVELKLKLMLMPMKKQIVELVESRLDRLLGNS